MRRQYITNLRFQISYTLSIMKGLFLSLLGPLLLVVFGLHLIAQDPSVSDAQQAIIYTGINHIIVSFLWCLGGALILVGILGVYMSYKYIGPIKRLEVWFEKRLKEAENNDAISLRPGDDLAGVADILNKLFTKYRKI